MNRLSSFRPLLRFVLLMAVGLVGCSDRPADSREDSGRLGHPKHELREETTENRREEDAPSIDELLGMLSDAPTPIRCDALRELQKLGRDGAAALSAVMALFQEDELDVTVRCEAALALASIGAEDATVSAALVQALDNEHEDIQCAAEEAVNRVGQPAVPALLKAIRSPMSSMRIKAAQSLAKIKPPSKETIASLIAAMDDEDTDVQRAAIRALGAHGEHAKAAMPRLVEKTKRDWKVSRSAVNALAQMGPDAAGALVASLSDHLNHHQACPALMEMGEPAIPALIEGLEEDSPYVLEGVFAVLEKMEPIPGESVAVALVRFMERHPRGSMSRGAEVPVLARIGAPAVAPLTGALKNESAFVRGQAAAALAAMGEVAKPAATELREMLEDPNPNVAYRAAFALVNLGDGESDEVREPLLRKLAEPASNSDQAEAAGALARVGADAERVMKILLSQDRPPRYSAYQELVKKLGADAVPPLLAAFRSDNERLRDYVCTCFEWLGPAASPATSGLVAVLEDEDWIVRMKACMCLRSIGPGAAAAVPALQRATKDENTYVRGSAYRAICAIVPERAPKMLIEGLDDPKTFTPHLIMCLDELGPKAKDAIPALIRRYANDSREEDKYYRFKEITCEGVIAAVGPEVIPVITATLDDPNSPVRARRLAVGALGKMREQAEVALPALVKEFLTNREEDREETSLKERVVATVLVSGPKAIPAVAEIYEKSDAKLRAVIISQLGQAQSPLPYLELLVKALEDAEPGETGSQVRYSAASAIQKIGPYSEEAVPALITCLGDSDWRVRSAAAGALGAIGRKAKDAVEPLRKLRDNESDRRLRMTIDQALVRISPGT